MQIVRDELDRYGLTELLGADAIYPTVDAAVQAFRAMPRLPTADAVSYVRGAGRTTGTSSAEPPAATKSSIINSRTRSVITSRRALGVFAHPRGQQRRREALVGGPVPLHPFAAQELAVLEPGVEPLHLFVGGLETEHRPEEREEIARGSRDPSPRTRPERRWPSSSCRRAPGRTWCSSPSACRAESRASAAVGSPSHSGAWIEQPGSEARPRRRCGA